MPVNIPQLQTEIQTDPAGVGYATYTGTYNDQGVVNLLNSLTSAGTGLIFREQVPSQYLFHNITSGDFANLSSIQLQQLTCLLAANYIDCQQPNVRNILSVLFPTGTATRTNLQQYMRRVGSRAEILFGVNTVITSSHISLALRGA